MLDSSADWCLHITKKPTITYVAVHVHGRTMSYATEPVERQYQTHLFVGTFFRPEEYRDQFEEFCLGSKLHLYKH